MKSLKAKMIALILPVFILLFVITIVYSFSNARKIIIESKYEELSKFSNAEKDNMENWFHSKLVVLESTKTSLENSDITPQEMGGIFNKLVSKSNGEFADIYVGTTEGIMIHSGNFTFNSDYDPRKRPWYSEGMSFEKFTFGKPYIDNGTKKLAISASAKVNNKDGSFFGIMAGDIVLEKVSQIIENIKYGETGYAYIVDKTDGTIMAHSLKKENIGKKIIDEGADLEGLQNELMNKDEGIYNYSIDGNKEFAAFASLPDLNWNLVVVISEKEVLAKVTSYTLAISILGIIAIILLIVLVERISNSIAKPIKNLANKVTEISEGNLNVTIDVKGNDEIALLSNEFNKFTFKLKDSMTKIKNLVSTSKESNQVIEKSIDNIIKGENSKY